MMGGDGQDSTDSDVISLSLKCIKVMFKDLCKIYTACSIVLGCYAVGYTGKPCFTQSICKHIFHNFS